MLGGKSWDQWIGQYAESHQHPVNRLCHTFGIPLIALSLPLFLVVLSVPGFWPRAARDVRWRVGAAVRRPCGGGKAARVLPRLALPVRGVAVVGGQDAGPRIRASLYRLDAGAGMP